MSDSDDGQRRPASGVRPIAAIGVPLSLGADFAGIERAPAALRQAGALAALADAGRVVRDRGDIAVPPAAAYGARRDPPALNHLHAIARVNRALCLAAGAAARAGEMPLVLGGDHSVAIGTLAGLQAAAGPIGVVWIDAHGDMNTHRTTPSGHIHGMSLAAALGFGHPKLTDIGGRSVRLDPANVALIGVRSLDPGELRFIRRHGIRVYSAADVRRLGAERVAAEAVAHAGRGARGIHVSFDMDVLDPAEAPGVSTPVPGGLRAAEALAALDAVRRSGRVVGAEFVEVNPRMDSGGATVRLAVRLIGRLFS